MLKKTAHFSRRWREETGGKPPSTTEVNQWIEKECVIIQKHKELFTARGMRCDIMALYWHPRKEVIFKVDEKRKTIVTVLTGYTLHNTYRQREAICDNMPFIRHFSGSRHHQKLEEFDETDMSLMRGRP
ncbi:MAG: hypothetical protein KAV87_36150 [Desulfobacteraceae bacterium]|nr:hypothetical protein [Desulfobacteraceae bacterium]